MNLDVKTPNERICNIIKTIAPKIIITENKYLNIFKEFKNIKVILIDEIDFNYVDNDFEIIQKRLNRIIRHRSLLCDKHIRINEIPKG